MTLSVTILIQMHGKVFTTDLNTTTKSIFNNVRLLCKAEGFNDFEHRRYNELILHGSMIDKFRHNLDLSTYDILKESKTGDLLGNITYDKVLSRTVGNLGFLESLNPADMATDQFQNIYLISIHDGNTLIYPIEETGEWINLLKLDDINRLANWFHRRVPNIIDMSTPFPNQITYLNEEDIVKQSNASYSEKERRIRQIKQQYLNALESWSLTLESSNKIKTIKLSFLVELVKTIIADDCIINLLDYSCNSRIINILDKDGYQYYKDNVINKKTNKHDDMLDFMERGIQLYTNLGGSKNKRIHINGKLVKKIKTRVKNKYMQKYKKHRVKKANKTKKIKNK